MNMKKGKKQPRTPDIMRKGGAMRDPGVRIVQDSSEVAVVGFLEVLSHLPAIRGAMRDRTKYSRKKKHKHA